MKDQILAAVKTIQLEKCIIRGNSIRRPTESMDKIDRLKNKKKNDRDQ